MSIPETPSPTSPTLEPTPHTRALLRALREGDVLSPTAGGLAGLSTVVATGVDSEGDPIITVVSGAGRRSVVTTAPESVTAWNLLPVHRPEPDRSLDVAGPVVER